VGRWLAYEVVPVVVAFGFVVYGSGLTDVMVGNLHFMHSRERSSYDQTVKIVQQCTYNKSRTKGMVAFIQ